ncbi:MAG TPA: type II toxin-antitoxin system RelE/ParE family toxin [Pirellulales bacterium]|nr:type II toxin-antitoxin system RelE/ParE family toxin [Pirellulales bacterium]
MATVLITTEAQEQYHALPKTVRTRIETIFARLEVWPDVSGAKALRGELAGRFRMRSGDYRVQFRVAGDVVTVEKVGHRDGFYEA